MSFNLPTGMALATLTLTTIFAAPSIANKSDQLATDITSSMEKFYGKPRSSVESFLGKTFGISTPIKAEGGSYTYMIPADGRKCGELTLDTNNDTVTSWQTIIWDRKETHERGRACEAAFQQKMSNL